MIDSLQITPRSPNRSMQLQQAIGDGLFSVIRSELEQHQREQQTQQRIQRAAQLSTMFFGGK